MSKSKSRSKSKPARKPRPRDGELADETLDQVAGGGGTATDMSQMQQLELQDALQKQQQAFQTLSNMSKSVHDTAKAIIANVKA